MAPVQEPRRLGSPPWRADPCLVYQAQVVGIDNLGQRRVVSFTTHAMTPRPDGSGFRVELSGGQVEPGTGNERVALELTQDFRGFRSELPPGSLGLIFTDGFETGDISA